MIDCYLFAGLAALGLVAILYAVHRKPQPRYHLRNPRYGIPDNVKWEDGRPYTTE